MDCMDPASHLVNCSVRLTGNFGRYPRNCFMHGLDHLNNWPSDACSIEQGWLASLRDLNPPPLAQTDLREIPADLLKGHSKRF